MGLFVLNASVCTDRAVFTKCHYLHGQLLFLRKAILGKNSPILAKKHSRQE
jgi:hypothetical protein